MSICKYTHPYTNNQRQDPINDCQIVGQGVAIAPGYILTAAHVLQGNDQDRFGIQDNEPTLNNIQNQRLHDTLDLALISYEGI